MTRLTVTSTSADAGLAVPFVELEAPPTPDGVAALRSRGVRGTGLRSGSWARGRRVLDWLAELQPLVLHVSAHGTVPTLPPEALAEVRSGLHELEYVRLDMARGPRAPFDFRCDDPPRRLRELWVMDAVPCRPRRRPRTRRPSRPRTV